MKFPEDCLDKSLLTIEDYIMIRNLNDESNHACCKLISNIHKKIRDNIGLGMNVKLYQVDELPKSEGGKLNRIIDNRHL